MSWSATPNGASTIARISCRKKPSPRIACRASPPRSKTYSCSSSPPIWPAGGRRHEIRRIKAIAVKELLQVWRDPRSLMIALLLPFTQMFLFGYGVTSISSTSRSAPSTAKPARTARRCSSISRRRCISAIARNVTSYPELVAAIDHADCSFAIVVPPDFSERLNDAGSSRPGHHRRHRRQHAPISRSAMRRRSSHGYSSEVVLDALDRQGRRCSKSSR